MLPVVEPDSGIVPAPTKIPFILIDQFLAPVLLRCLQKLNWLIVRLYPEATSIVNVIVGVPLVLLIAIACPIDPEKLVQALLLLLQEELLRFELKTPGATVYG